MQRYTLHERLGMGGMGVVYRATDRLTGNTIALKQVNRLLPGSASNGTTGHLRLSLTHEFRVLAALRHPHIISVLDYGFSADGQPFYTMTLIDQPQTILEAGAGRPLTEQVALLRQVLSALDYLHRHGILHRDLKPANVLVGPDGEVRLLDFGLAAGQGQAEGMVGTVPYMAPEIFKDHPASIASDLYAVGVLGYELLTGQHPFQGNTIPLMINAILTDAPDMGRLPPMVREVVGRLLDKDPAGRYPDAASVARELQPDAVAPIEVRESYLQAAPFVGRETELGHLLEALQAITSDAPTGSLWLVGGESGVGKSRVIEELRTHALVAGVAVVRGNAFENGGLPYQLWRDPARHLVLHVSLDDLAAAVLKAVVPDIGALLGRDIADPPSLAGTDAHKRLVLALLDLVRRQPTPLLILLEDLQWVTESLEAVRQLAPLLSGLPVMIVGTYRDDEVPDLPTQLPSANVLQLRRLGAAPIAALTQAMLGQASPRVVAFLEQQTEGNVFFLVEMVRSLAESAGDLSAIDSSKLPQQVFPGGVRQIVQRRLNKVPDWARPMLHLAAVQGTEIDPAVLLAANPTERFEEWLATCSAVAVLTRQDEHWRFAHDKLRQGVLESLTDRAPLHRQIATAIETVYPDADAHAALLVDHWHAAGDVTRAIHYTHIAARQHLAVSAFREAKTLLGRMLTLEMPDSDRAALLEALGEAHLNTGDHDAARTVYAQVQTLAAPDALEYIRALNGLGTVALYTGDQETARQSFETALARHDGPLLADIYNRLAGLAYYQQDLAQARTYLENALAAARATGDQGKVAKLVGNLGAIVQDQGEIEQAGVYFRQSLELCEALGDRLGASNALLNLGGNCMEAAAPHQAEDYYRQAIAAKRDINDRQGMLHGMARLVNVYLATNQPSAAARLLDEALDMTDMHGSSRFLSVFIGLARLRLAGGDAVGAAELAGLVQAHPKAYQTQMGYLRGVVLKRVEALLAPDVLQAALARGAALSLSDAIALARVWTTTKYE